MQKTVDLLSFILSVAIYLVALMLTLYLSNKVVQTFDDVKYTKDKDAYMDVYVADIDDSPIPTAPERALEEISELNVEAKDEKVEEEKLKTTHKKVDEAPKPTPTKEESKSEPVKDIIPEPTLDPKPIEDKKEEPKTEPVKEETPIDLFSDIDSDKLSKAAKAEEAVQSRKKSDLETKQASQKSTSAQNTDKKSDKSAGKSQRTGVYNAFIGEVETILTRVWSTYRAIPNQDATVEITIDANGRLSYNITQLAYDSAFNQKFRDFLNKVEGMQFPKPPGGTPYTHKYKMKDLIR